MKKKLNLKKILIITLIILAIGTGAVMAGVRLQQISLEERLYKQFMTSQDENMNGMYDIFTAEAVNYIMDADLFGKEDVSDAIYTIALDLNDAGLEQEARDIFNEETMELALKEAQTKVYNLLKNTILSNPANNWTTKEAKLKVSGDDLTLRQMVKAYVRYHVALSMTGVGAPAPQ